MRTDIVPSSLHCAATHALLRGHDCVARASLPPGTPMQMACTKHKVSAASHAQPTGSFPQQALATLGQSPAEVPHILEASKRECSPVYP